MNTQEINDNFTAVRLSFKWMGNKRQLNEQQTEQAAAGFDADSSYVKASKLLVSTKNDKWKAMVKIKGMIKKFWESVSVPYPEDGLRLTKRTTVARISERAISFGIDFTTGLDELQVAWPDICLASRLKLGSLYDASDYPDDIREEFGFRFDFPSVQPPAYLMQLDPGLYQEQVTRMHARFSQAIELAESAFVNQFQELLSNIVDKLENNEDGKRKKFQDSLVGNLSNFFDRFKELNVTENDELEALVNQAKAVVGGNTAAGIRDDDQLRNGIRNSMQTVARGLDEMIVNRPRRMLG